MKNVLILFLALALLLVCAMGGAVNRALNEENQKQATVIGTQSETNLYQAQALKELAKANSDQAQAIKAQAEASKADKALLSALAWVFGAAQLVLVLAVIIRMGRKPKASQVQLVAWPMREPKGARHVGR
jgi:Na+-transporting methylmalonyl-CoA/oxaloacetate decarboxylase gamma subunit